MVIRRFDEIINDLCIWLVYHLISWISMFMNLFIINIILLLIIELYQYQTKVLFLCMPTNILIHWINKL
jgi:hypothetical protein